jgi:glutamate formiminotransferase
MVCSIVECVPNVSEGRDRPVIDRIADAVRSVHRVKLADIHADPDHHRSVFTFLGPPPDVEIAALALAEASLAAIDMRRHRGVHPRTGALDVLPFIPLRAMTMGETAALAHRVGQTLGARFALLVYFYGEAALRPDRRRLSEIRRGEYEALEKRLADPAFAPDAGPARFNPRSGATSVGAREILVAYNVWLSSDDQEVARAIARAVRESSGGLPGLQAMGVPLRSRGLVQVSMNLLDLRRTPLPLVFDRVQREASQRGVKVLRGELVGLVPREAFAGEPPERAGLPDFTPEQLLENHIPPEGPGVS